MQDSIRVSAKTVDDAITEALVQLGLTSDMIEYDVISKGSSGFLGIGKKQAVIEVRKKQASKNNRATNEKKALHATASKKAEKAETDKSIEEEAVISSALGEDTENEPPRRSSLRVVPATEETLAVVEKFLKETFDAMKMDIAISSTIDEDGILCIEMNGENMGILIGKHGQTLDALQYLSNRVANKNQAGYVRVKLDTEDYRSKREAALKNLARSVAFRAKKEHHSISLEPMNPYERRIIHSALQSNPFVITHSEGKEPNRRVVVTLKR